MADSPVQSVVGPELQSLPLPVIISAAMNGIVSAQAISARTTIDFLKSVTGQVKFNASVADAANQTKQVEVSVPELAVVPIPSIHVDSATIHFNFEVKEILTQTKANDSNLNLNVEAKGLLKAILNASLSGSIAHKSSTENTLNRSGMLDITIHLSEPAIPEGLGKVLNILSNSITMTPQGQ